jgi:hypothetical protein
MTNNTNTPKPTDLKQATAIVTAYRNAGNGSNRTQWSRMTAMLACVLYVLRTGNPAEVTDLFTDGTSPVYHQAHRMLSAGVLRDYWSQVTVESVRPDGTTTTTGKVGQVRTYIVPAVTV